MNLGLEFLYIKSIVVSVDGGSMYVEFTFLQEYLFLMVDMLLDAFFSICAWEFILHSDIGVFIKGSSCDVFLFLRGIVFFGLRPHFDTFTLYYFKSKVTILPQSKSLYSLYFQVKADLLRNDLYIFIIFIWVAARNGWLQEMSGC